MIEHTAKTGNGDAKLLVDEEYGLCLVLVDQHGSHWLHHPDGYYRRVAAGEASLVPHAPALKAVK